jgi:NADPH:quinone reductase-like Zn-dependent oxidoreductase
VHGAAGAVGSMVTQVAREFGAYVIGTGRVADRQTALTSARTSSSTSTTTRWKKSVKSIWCSMSSAYDIGKRPARLVRAGGTLVSFVGLFQARPADGLAVDFVVESDRAQLSEIIQRVRDGRRRTNIGNVSTLDDAVAAFNPTERREGKTIIRVRP